MITLSGAIPRLGITAMYYVEMSAIQGHLPVFSVGGIVLAGVVSYWMVQAFLAAIIGLKLQQKRLARYYGVILPAQMQRPPWQAVQPTRQAWNPSRGF